MKLEHRGQPLLPVEAFLPRVFRYSFGLIFLVVAGLIFTSLVHRLLHRFHIRADLKCAGGNAGRLYVPRTFGMAVRQPAPHRGIG